MRLRTQARRQIAGYVDYMWEMKKALGVSADEGKNKQGTEIDPAARGIEGA